MGGDSRCVSPGATRSWLIAVLGLLALFSGFGVGIVTGPLAAFDRSRAAMDVLIHGPPVVQVIPRVPPVAIAGVPVPSVIAAAQPLGGGAGTRGGAGARADRAADPAHGVRIGGSGRARPSHSRRVPHHARDVTRDPAGRRACSVVGVSAGAAADLVRDGADQRRPGTRHP
jgi:hypothetical protein